MYNVPDHALQKEQLSMYAPFFHDVYCGVPFGNAHLLVCGF